MKKNIYLCNYLNLEKNPKYLQIIEEFNEKGIDNPYLVDDILKSQLKSDLLNKNIDIKINKNLVQKYFNKYFENKKIKDEYEYDHSYNDFPKEVIDINSPVFEQISENGMLEKFNVLITLNRKIDSKLKNNYSSVFNKLNESKTKYPSILVNIQNNTNLNYLTQYKIDFEQIKCLTIKANEEYIYEKRKYSDKIKKIIKKNVINYKVCLGLEKNLIYLNLSNKLDKYINIDSFFIFDNFVSLEHLVLSGFFFNKILAIKLKKLKTLKIENSRYIKLDSESFINLKELYFFIDYDNLQGWNSYCSLLNILSLKNLKYLNINIVKKLEDQKNFLETIFSIKSLEYIDIALKNDIDDNILNIYGQNSLVKNLNVKFCPNDTESFNCILYNLQYKFPNINNLSFLSFENELLMDYLVFSDLQKEGVILEIDENRNFRIEKIILKINYNKIIKFFCGPFENIIVLDIEYKYWRINNIENCFPIFNNNCPILKNLKKFSLKTYLIEHKVLNNIYNNLEKCMPNLKYFELYCFTNDIINDLYIKFIIRLLSSEALLKLEEIYLAIQYKEEIFTEKYEEWRKILDSKLFSSSEVYLIKELKEFCPFYNINKYKKIWIRKNDKYNSFKK